LGLFRSNTLNARINDSIKAYEGSLSSVRAVVTDGQFKGAIFFGNATMDKVTKNVLVNFDTFIPPGSMSTYKTAAELKSQDGSSGIEGRIESDYWRYFWTQIALDTASAAADATTQRAGNSFGTFTVVPGPDSTIKQGIAGGLNKTAERLSERNQYVPEYVVVDGPIFVRISIKEQPERN
jgi:hypothetical protein